MTFSFGNVYLSFQGTGQGGFHEGFDVLCGDNPPQPTGGYANWSVVNRPLGRGMTKLDGYSPAQMSVEVRFGEWTPGWDESDAAGARNEEKIRTLERMAGATTSWGVPPIVYVFSYKPGGQSDLIPKTYQGMPWVINGGIQWGTSYRNTNGFRTRQDATFTLLNYLNLNKPPDPTTSVRGGYFRTAPGNQTALQIAGNRTSHSPTVDVQSLARSILNAPQNHPCKGTRISLARKSVSWPIPVGVAVFVPTHTATF